MFSKAQKSLQEQILEYLGNWEGHVHVSSLTLLKLTEEKKEEEERFKDNIFTAAAAAAAASPLLVAEKAARGLRRSLHRDGARMRRERGGGTRRPWSRWSRRQRRLDLLTQGVGQFV